MDEAVTPLPIPERTPPVTTTILRSSDSVLLNKSASLGGRLCSFELVKDDGRNVAILGVIRKG